MSPVLRSFICIEVSKSDRAGPNTAYLDVPPGFFGYPTCFNDLMLELDVFHAAIFLSHLLPILINISGLGVELRPFMIWLKSQLVCMSRNVYF